MASYNYTFTSGDTVTPTKLNSARTVSDIVNADIKSDAAIAHTKLANITAGQVLLGNASNVPTATALSGDVTVTSGGVTAIGSGVIVDADVNASAAIAGTKIAPNFGSQNIVTTGTIQATGTGSSYAVLSGGNSDGATLQLNRGGSASQNAYIAQYQSALYIKNLDGGPTVFTNTTSDTERMRLSGAALLVGKTVDDIPTTGCCILGSGVIRASGSDVTFVLNRTVNGQIQNFRRSDAQVGNISVTTTATTYATSSDYRLKQNIEPMVGGLSKLSALAPKTFEFKAEPNVRVDGFIAHEVQAVVPQAVTGEKDGEDMQGLDMSKLVPVLVAAIQELSAKVAALEAAQS